MFEAVERFNKEIIGIDRQLGHRLDEDEFKLLIGFFMEEIKEFTEAYENGDYVAQVDALVDLSYFSVGGLTRLGVPSAKARAIFDVVQEKNMSKKKGRKEQRKVVGDLDAVKPEDWVGPEEQIKQILER